MKKLFAIIVTIAVVVCGAVPAMAYFENQNLTLVAYNWLDQEVAVDLGNYETTDFNVKGQTLAAAGSVALNKFGAAVDSWDDLHVGVYVGFLDSSNVNHFIFGTTLEKTPNSVNKKTAISFVNASTLSHSYFGTGSDLQAVTVSASNNNSYSKQMDKLAYGQMAGYNTIAGDAGPTLSALSTVGYIDLYLWERIGTATQTLVSDVNGDLHQGTIRLYADGSITTTPIPGALVLFASGLVGLIGIRRKNS